MHVSAIGTEASIATQQAVEEGLPEVLNKIKEVKVAVNAIKSISENTVKRVFRIKPEFLEAE